MNSNVNKRNILVPVINYEHLVKTCGGVDVYSHAFASYMYDVMSPIRALKAIKPNFKTEYISPCTDLLGL
jgi:hypothetical protein